MNTNKHPDTYLERYLADVRSDMYKLREYVLIIGNTKPYKDILKDVSLVPSLFIKDYNEKAGSILVECDHHTYCDLLSNSDIADISFTIRD